MKNLKNKPGLPLWAFLSIAAAIVLFYFFDIGCIWRRLFGIPCMGCGMTRAWCAFLKGNLKTAFQMHAMFWSMPILLLYIVFNGKLFKQKVLNLSVLVFIALGFIINYIFLLLE